MSERVIFHFTMVIEEAEPSLAVASIRRIEDKATCYNFPKHLQHSKHHQPLLQIKTVKSATANMTKVGQYRNLNLTLPADLARLYLDDEGNFMFKNVYLEESEIAQNGSSTAVHDCVGPAPAMPELNLADIDRKFNLDKFTGKQDAKTWIVTFDAECARFRILDSTQKVTILKLFLESGARDWYAASIIKFPTSEWKIWKESFEKVFATKGWSQVRAAYHYRFISGSLVDYALRKELLLLEVERQISAISLINHIVVGLPINIQDKLDREHLTTTDALINELRRYEVPTLSSKSAVNRSVPAKPASKPGTTTETTPDRRPCYICEKLGKPNRYHPVSACRNNKSSDATMKINVHDINLQEIDEFTKLELQDEKN